MNNMVEANTDSSLVIRMWKDATFREQMSAQWAALPAHPAGSSAVSLEVEGTNVYPSDWDTCTLGGGTICGTDNGFRDG